jgi:hypothetical protein
VVSAIRKAIWSEKTEDVNFYSPLAADKLKAALQE